MKKVTCVDCGRAREPFRPVLRRLDGSVAFACRQCWRALDNQEFMHNAMDDADQIALTRAMR